MEFQIQNFTKLLKNAVDAKQFFFTDDEEKLNEMSVACEKGKSELNSSSSIISSNSMSSPSLGGGGGGGAGPKFGAEGYNINRMLALSEKSRTVNQKSHSQVSCPCYTRDSAGVENLSCILQ